MSFINTNESFWISVKNEESMILVLRILLTQQWDFSKPSWVAKMTVHAKPNATLEGPHRAEREDAKFN